LHHIINCYIYFLTACSKGLTSKTQVQDSTGNAKPKVDNSKDMATKAKIADYYPFEKSIKYLYFGEGNESKKN